MYFPLFPIQDRLIVILSLIDEIIEYEEFLKPLEVSLLQHACLKDKSGMLFQKRSCELHSRHTFEV